MYMVNIIDAKNDVLLITSQANGTTSLPLPYATLMSDSNKLVTMLEEAYDYATNVTFTLRVEGEKSGAAAADDVY